MLRLFVLAALATLAIPVLMPQRFATTFYLSEWVPLFMCAEIVISAIMLKIWYSRNDFVRCLVFGLVFVLLRLLFCFAGSLIDPAADILWVPVEHRWSKGVVPAMTYMYSTWYVAGTQYVALMLWLPAMLEKLLPGIFRHPPGRRSLARMSGFSLAGADGRGKTKSFLDVEKELAMVPELMAWTVFSPERLPVWHSGRESGMIEAEREAHRRLEQMCEPMLWSEWGDDVSRTLFHAVDECYVVTAFSDGFLFGSIWQVEDDGFPARTVLQEVLERMERWLNERFLEPA